MNKATQDLFAAMFVVSNERRIDDAKDAIAAGADVNAKDEHGWTALQWVVPRGRDGADIAIMLIEAGADPDTEDDNGVTPRMFLGIFNSPYDQDFVDKIREAIDHQRA